MTPTATATGLAAKSSNTPDSLQHQFWNPKGGGLPVSSDITKGAAPVPPSRGKIAEWLLPGGSEPDPRLTLANERTFLAWIRTSLALLAGGIAIEAFTADLFLEPVRNGLAVLVLLLGLMLSAGSGVRWLQVERSMRHKAPLPLPLIVPLLATAGALAAAVVLVVTLWR